MLLLVSCSTAFKLLMQGEQEGQIESEYLILLNGMQSSDNN